MIYEYMAKHAFIVLMCVDCALIDLPDDISFVEAEFNKLSAETFIVQAKVFQISSWHFGKILDFWCLHTRAC